MAIQSSRGKRVRWNVASGAWRQGPLRAQLEETTPLSRKRQKDHMSCGSKDVNKFKCDDHARKWVIGLNTHKSVSL